MVLVWMAPTKLAQSTKKSEAFMAVQQLFLTQKMGGSTVAGDNEVSDDKWNLMTHLGSCVIIPDDYSKNQSAILLARSQPESLKLVKPVRTR